MPRLASDDVPVASAAYRHFRDGSVSRPCRARSQKRPTMALQSPPNDRPSRTGPCSDEPPIGRRPRTTSRARVDVPHLLPQHSAEHGFGRVGRPEDEGSPVEMASIRDPRSSSARVCAPSRVASRFPSSAPRHHVFVWAGRSVDATVVSRRCTLRTGREPLAARAFGHVYQPSWAVWCEQQSGPWRRKRKECDPNVPPDEISLSQMHTPVPFRNAGRDGAACSLQG